MSHKHKASTGTDALRMYYIWGSIYCNWRHTERHMCNKTSKTSTIPFCFVWQSSVLFFSDKLSEKGGAALAAGIVRTWCNFKINCEYFLRETFFFCAFDTLSRALSQFTGTAWVCHSSLSQHSRSTSIPLSHCLSFGEIWTNKMILAIISCLLAAVGVGVRGLYPLTIGSDSVK